MTHSVFSPTDKRRLSLLLDIRRDNFSILRAYSLLLNAAPDCIHAKEIEELTGDLSALPPDTATQMRTYAMYGMLCARLSFDPEATDKNRAFAKTYLLPSLCCLSPATVEDDPYIRTVPFQSVTDGEWELSTEHYRPYELFPMDEARLLSSLREIPQIGFFPRAVAYPAVKQGGREWMTVTPNEIATMKAPVAAAHGRVMALGLGLGYFAFMASEKKEVDAVTVIERDPTVIRLFKTHLLPHMPNGDKIRIIEADALDYVEKEVKSGVTDLLFADLWHDPSDGVELYLRLAAMEKNAPKIERHYWLLSTLLSHLRWRVLARVAAENGCEEGEAEDPYADRLLAASPVTSYDALIALLSEKGLKSAISKANFTF